MSTVRREEALKISTYQRENAKVVKLLEQAATQEPSSSGYQWVSGDRSNMVDVVTFRQSGTAKGSLERFCEANDIPKSVYDRLRAAVAAGAHRQRASGGIVKFTVTPESLEKLKDQLDQMAISRDTRPEDGKLTGKELTSFKKLDNGKAATNVRASDALGEIKLRGNRTEHKYSRQVNYVMDLLYSQGSIHGPDQVERIAGELPAAQAKAVRAAYAAVSRYLSRGATSESSFICMDQRREVQRGLMRTFGASLDTTEKAISALRLPRGY
jgi:hypothetical protein